VQDIGVGGTTVLQWIFKKCDGRHERPWQCGMITGYQHIRLLLHYKEEVPNTCDCLETALFIQKILCFNTSLVF
jgi:hypothetical protein